MTAPKTSAPASVTSESRVYTLGRDNTSRPTRVAATPSDAASVGTISSPQANAAPASMPQTLAGTHSTQSASVIANPRDASLTGSIHSLDGHGSLGTHIPATVEGKTSPQATARSAPITGPPAGATTTAAAIPESEPTSPPPLPYQTSQADHCGVASHDGPVGLAATPPRTAIQEAPPRMLSPSGDQLPREAIGAPTPNAATPLAGQTPLPASDATTPKGGLPGVDKQDPQAPASLLSTPIREAPELADPLLALAADVLDDLESVWIANTNRLRQLTRDEEDSDGEERGFGLTLDHPDVARLAVLVGALEQAQQDATKNLTKRLKQHPLAPWLKAQKGVGDKQAARLLAAIGDPYWNSLHDRPRTVSELWAYAGYHVLPAGQAGNDAHPSLASGGKTGHPDQVERDTHRQPVGVAPKRARGAKANWSATAKMRTYLIAESCMKQLRKPCEKDAELGYALHVEGCQCSPFRVIYDATRAKYADATHAVECVRCGPKGKPAAAGSDLSDAHKMARALRAVSKELLKELWREARRLHLGESEETQ